MPGPLYRILRTALFALPPDESHTLAGASLRLASALPGVRGLVTALNSYRDPALELEVLGMRFANPVGLAAGFDKDARFVRGIPLLGLGYTELGTVTPQAQPPNPRPRLFRLTAQRALINRMGFNNRGAEAMACRLKRLTAGGSLPFPVGVNLGKNRDTPLAEAAADYLAGLEHLYRYADYLVVNVSSPNTPGLRDLQAPARLRGLLEELVPAAARLAAAAGRPLVPVLLKLAPDLDDDDLPGVIATARRAGISGFVAANTTLDRQGLADRWQKEVGGLSGAPLARRSTDLIARIWRLTGGEVPIIGVGGIEDAASAWEKVRAGACLLQVYTGLVYEGPGLVRRICRGLVEYLRSVGMDHLSQAVGSAHR